VWKLVKRVLPISGSAVALLAWSNRDEVLEWAGFGVRATRKLLDHERTDVATEARLRLALNRDRRTARAPGLRVEVRDGVVILRGVVDHGVRPVAVALARQTRGVTAVDDVLLDELPGR
jgi:hypothetical protein